MKKPFKFRYVHELVGSFVLLVLLAVIVAVLLAGRAQGWFEPTHEVRVEFSEEGTFGLRRGAEVRVLEAPAGIVHDIVVREDGVMEGILRVRGRFFQYIRKDSQAMVKRVFGVAGDAYVEISRGVGEELSEDDPYIDIAKDTEIMDVVEEVLEELRESILVAMNQLGDLLEEYTALATDFRDPEGHVQKVLGNISAITEGLERGQGPAGRLLRDEDLAGHIDELAVKINRTMDDVNSIMENMAEASKEFPEMARTAGGEVRDMKGLVSQTQSSLQEAEILIEGIQRHWLIRKYIDRDDPPEDDRLAPSSVMGSGGDSK